MDGLLHGKSENKMDDDWGYLHDLGNLHIAVPLMDIMSIGQQLKPLKGWHDITTRGKGADFQSVWLSDSKRWSFLKFWWETWVYVWFMYVPSGYLTF